MIPQEEVWEAEKHSHHEESGGWTPPEGTQEEGVQNF